MPSPKKFSTLILEHEESQLADAQISVDRLAYARELLPQLEEAAEESELRVVDIETAWKRMSGEDPTPAEYVEAQAAQTRATLQLKAGQVELQRAERDARTTDATAAEVFARVVRAAYPTIEVHSTWAVPPAPANEGDYPALVVTSTANSSHDLTEGVVTGLVQVRMFRIDGIHVPLDFERIEKAAADLGVEMRKAQAHALRVVISTALGGGRMRDTVALEIRGAQAGLPIIEAIAPTAVSRVGHAIAAELANRIVAPYDLRAYAEHSQNTTMYYSSAIAAVPHEAVIISEDVSKSGERTIVIESLVVFRAFGASAGRSTGAELDAFINRLGRGYFMHGLGNVQSAEVVTEDSTLRLGETERNTIGRRLNPPTMGVRDSGNAALENILSFGQVAVRTTIKSQLPA